jgi:hypothetical protein
MIITVTLHCQGFQGPCSSAISTGLRDSIGLPTSAVRDGNTNVTTGALASSARNGGWDVRPVATDKGETIQARCPRCKDALLDWTAAQCERAISGLPLDVEEVKTNPHTCRTPTMSESIINIRTGDEWRCQHCLTRWVANREEESWTRSPA